VAPVADQPATECTAEFNQAMPAKPWTKDTPVKEFEPLINLIDQHTQSDMFRHAGDKYQANDDYYDIAQNLEAQGQSSGHVTFTNGVTADVQQVAGSLTQLILEDKAAGLKETVTLNETTQRIETDKVEFCGVSRSRKFSTGGEYYRSYGFEGGSVEKTGPLPELKLD
jgi:hypothetical protein